MQFLTAGDLSRLLRVDLKTIHNWVNRGRFRAERTSGRHLRFRRVEVIRSLRSFGRPVPRALGKAPPSVALTVQSFRRAQAGAGMNVVCAPGLLLLALEVGAGEREVVVLDLDESPVSQTRALVRALRGKERTAGVALVGLSTRAERRHRFVAEGGDVALGSRDVAAVTSAIRWVTGGIERPPRGAVTAFDGVA